MKNELDEPYALDLADDECFLNPVKFEDFSYVLERKWFDGKITRYSVQVTNPIISEKGNIIAGLCFSKLKKKSNKNNIKNTERSIIKLDDVNFSVGTPQSFIDGLNTKLLGKYKSFMNPTTAEKIFGKAFDHYQEKISSVYGVLPSVT